MSESGKETGPFSALIDALPDSLPCEAPPNPNFPWRGFYGGDVIHVAVTYDDHSSTSMGEKNIAAFKQAQTDLIDALSGVEFIFSRPGEDSVERFERLAAAFYRDTGVMMPGKDAPAAGGQPDIEERRKKCDAWIDAKIEAARSALLLSNTGGTGNG